jgi:hypothetical protein
VVEGLVGLGHGAIVVEQGGRGWHPRPIPPK